MAKAPTTPAIEDPTIKGALSRIGLASAGPATLVIVASKETKLSPETIWNAWSKVDQWARWGRPLVQNARWLEGRDWAVGAKFEQVRNLGAPIGRQVTVETVREVNQGQSVGWWDGTGPIKTCHLWFFEPLSEGGTRVHKTEVFTGILPFLFKPFLRRSLTKQFEDSVENLIRYAERVHPD